MQLIVTNESGEALSWECDTSAIEAAGLDGIFELDPPAGQLEPEASTKVKVTFTPEGPDTHSVVLPIYLDGNRERPYLELSLDGTGVYPRLLFDMPEFVLPPVPLGEVAKGLFYVENQGYEDLELRFRLPADRTRMPLELEFPEGKSVSLAKTRLPVVVSFSSSRPLAFTSRVDFLDQDENRYSIKVTGVTDNSVLTVHTFLTNYSEDRKYVKGPGGAVQFAANGAGDPGGGGDDAASASPRSADTASAGGSPKRTQTAARRARRGKRADKLSAKKKKRELQQRSAPGAVISWQTSDGDTEFATLPAADGFTAVQQAYFVGWLNQNLLPPEAQVTSFPADLADKGGVVVELIEGFLRKPIRGKIGAKVPKQKTELIAATLRQWKAVLNTLITCGALLHHVQPESLLPRELFIRHLLVTGPGAVHPGDRTSPAALQRTRMLEQRFARMAAPAWANLLFQIVKLFVVGRVNVRQYLSVPLVHPAEDRLLQQRQQQQDQQQVGSGKPAAASNGRGGRGGASKKAGGRGGGGGRGGAGPVETRLNSLPQLNGSNVQSASENLMLRWLNVLHEVSEAEVLPRRAASLRDLSDGVLLCSALRAYVPSLGATNEPLNDIKFGSPTAQELDDDTEPTAAPTLTAEEADANVSALCTALQQLDFPFVPDAEVVRRGSELQLLLMLTTVFNLLPQYMPKATIEFAGDLGQEVQKALALRNPTRHALAYTRTLTGDPNFKVAGSTFIVDPGSKVTCDLSFTSRFTRPARARLELKSRRDDGISRSILVFDLLSRVLSRKPQQTVAARTALYAPQTIAVEVTNPFDRDCTFVVSLEQPEASQIAVPLGTGRQAPPPKVVQFPDSFSLLGRRNAQGDLIVSVPASGKASVEVFFAAFEPDRRYGAHLVFVDTDIGEFM